VYGIGTGAELAVQMFRSGGIRAQTVMRSSNAPRSFAYDFGPSVSVVPSEAGGAELRRQEGDAIESVGRLDAPWAKDADGKAGDRILLAYDGDDYLVRIEFDGADRVLRAQTLAAAPVPKGRSGVG